MIDCTLGFLTHKIIYQQNYITNLMHKTDFNSSSCWFGSCFLPCLQDKLYNLVNTNIMLYLSKNQWPILPDLLCITLHHLHVSEYNIKTLTRTEGLGSNSDLILKVLRVVSKQ